MRVFLIIVLFAINTNQLQAKIKVENFFNFKLNEFENLSPEIIKFYKKKKLIIVSENINNELLFFNFDGSKNLNLKKKIKTYSESINSLDICQSKNLLAVAIDQKLKVYSKGIVLIYDLDNLEILKQIVVGYNPDMLTFTEECDYLFVVNEGEPNYKIQENPPGSLTKINLNFKNQKIASITSKEFFFNSSIELIGEIFSKEIINNRFVNFEPEYIALDEDNFRVYISLQENNAIAVFDYKLNKILYVKSLGLKSYSSCSIDLENDKSYSPIRSDKIFSTYEPDGIYYYNKKGTPLIFIANEGEIKNNKETGHKNFNKDFLKLKNRNTKKFKTHQFSNVNKKVLFGSRSFSILDLNIDLIWDSCDEIEKQVYYKNNFIHNSSKKNLRFDSSSPNNGPAPESILVKEIFNKIFIFITLENSGGVIIYDFSEEYPVFQDYLTFKSKKEDNFYGLGPEGLELININNEAFFIVIANEVSGDLSFFKITDSF